MLPTRDQIERAAYDRWLRRHRAHGHDRADWVGSEQELTFVLNYQIIAEHALLSSSQTTLGGQGPCRFCERAITRVSSRAPQPVVQGLARTSLYSTEICDECHEECRDPIAEHCEDFWSAIRGGATAKELGLTGDVDLLPVFKSLVVSTLLIMPDDELGYFPDTLEWANNPDHEFDRGHFSDSHFLIYQAPFLKKQSAIQLARRIDDKAPFPYMLLLIACNGIILQTSVPMCVRDQELEGRAVRMPARSLIDGEGPHFQQAHVSVLRLGAGHRRLTRGRFSGSTHALGLAMI